ncbi:hypothetical protein [Rhodococcus zopfii]|uniref:hypothetical protein n=1 Tax=Rhodococcus zopfii TaxID=43772 RepID=UPI000AED56A9|nr:hypothetical protein [Rhodococcus zopfii]
MPLPMVDHDHNLTPRRSVDDINPALVAGGNEDRVPDSARHGAEAPPGIRRHRKDAALALFAAADTAGSIDWDGRSPERDRIRVSARRAEPVPRHLSSGRSTENYCTGT